MTRSAKYEETVQRGAEEVARLVGERGTNGYASPEQARDLARRLSDNQLVCRIRKHRFTVPLIAQEIKNKDYHYFYSESGCEGGCGVVLCEEMSPSGHVYWSAPRYRDAKGYLSENGRIVGDSRDAMRLEYVRRVVRPTKIRAANLEPRPER
jgi:hypothetical protein